MLTNARASRHPVRWLFFASKAILCQQGDKIGRILTDRKAKTNKALMVSFANGERIEEVALTEIVLFEVVEL